MLPAREPNSNRADQRVSMFPDTDGVAILQIRGPAEQIVATHTALDDHARALRAAGDERTVGQIMTQTLVERVTGQRYAEDTQCRGPAGDGRSDVHRAGRR